MTFDVRLYFSGNVPHKVNEFLMRSNALRLATFAYRKEAHEYLRLADKLGIRTSMLIDSGAFTSWSIGKPVHLPDLIDYNTDLINRYGDRHHFIFISLDVIPGEKGRRATSEEIASAVDQSYANFLEMRQHFPGRYVLPVYHSGEDVRLRNAYLSLTDYICLSMDQGMSENVRLNWAKRAAAPGFKYHGLAATGNNMVTQVPWFSVDSSSWITVSGMGGILWPHGERFRVLPISSDSPSRYDAGAHYSTLTEYERAAAADKIKSFGFEPEQLCTEHEHRTMWNITMWLNAPWRRRLQRPVDLFA